MVTLMDINTRTFTISIFIYGDVDFSVDGTHYLTISVEINEYL